MTQDSLTRTITGRAGPARLRGLVAWLRELWLSHRTRHELERLSDQGLRDIGLSRADVEREVMAPFWKPVDYGALDRVRMRSSRARRYY
jgi:uncharacterized protein YjiS (DUF1127 family)